MSKRGSRKQGIASDLRGVGRLAIDGVTGVTDLVEAMHAAIAHPAALAGAAAPAATTGLTALVYRSVRGVTRLVGAGVDQSLSALAPVLGEGGASPRRDAVVAAINGVLGDHLEASRNPLAIPMQARLAAQPPQAGGRVLVLVHGLCLNDRQWQQAGHDYGEALARELGFSPVYLHYNTGRAVEANGRELAELLDRLLAEWPVPAKELVLLCHSMGGLVARRAIDIAYGEGLGWSEIPLRIVFLGTPHQGAPLERAGSWADQLIGISPYSAPFVRIGELRSAGIQDLRHGDTTPLPESVRAYAIAASLPSRGKDGGDGLVPIASAFGEHADAALDLGIPKSRRWLGRGIGHIEMLGNAAVYERIRKWLSAP